MTTVEFCLAVAAIFELHSIPAMIAATVSDSTYRARLYSSKTSSICGLIAMLFVMLAGVASLIH